MLQQLWWPEITNDACEAGKINQSGVLPLPIPKPAHLEIEIRKKKVDIENGCNYIEV